MHKHSSVQRRRSRPCLVSREYSSTSLTTEFGGSERMIKSTKRCLRKVIGQAKLHYNELITALTEIEAVINSRPLTYLSPDDLEEPLTPAHFLYGKRVLSFPDGLHQQDVDEGFEPTQSLLTRRLKHLNATLNHFWRRWRSEYLLELQEAHRYHGGRPDAAPPSVGDVVLVGDDDKPRGLWRLGKVISVIAGKDGRPRGAVLRVSSSMGQTATLQRPLQHLYPLEVAPRPMQQSTKQLDEADAPPPQPDDSGTPPVGNSLDSGDGEEPQQPSRTRPRRAAAIDARDRVKTCAVLESDFGTMYVL